MNIDINAENPKIIPPVEAKEYPLYFMDQFTAQASSPDSIRVYARFIPYRRVLGPVCVQPAQPVLDAEGNPTMDAEGNVMMTEPVYETQVVSREFAPSLQDGDAKVIEISNICPMTDPDAAQAAQALTGFVAQGGNVGTLALTALTLAMKQIGMQQGKFSQE